MANDLVPYSRLGDSTEPFDADSVRGTARTRERGGTADEAEADARKASAYGDRTFAAIRRADAAEHRQSRWDLGDLNTWLWIGAMCAIGILLAIAAYLLPAGQHAAPPPIHVW
jgi:hypothetical protein